VKVLIKYLLVACIVILESCKTGNIEAPKSRQNVYECALAIGLSKEMNAVAHPIKLFEDIKETLDSRAFTLSGLNIKSEFVRGIIFSKVTIAGYIEHIAEGEKIECIHPNIIRSLPISTAQNKVAEEYFFIQLLRHALQKMDKPYKIIKGSIFSAKELQDLQQRLAASPNLDLIQDHLIELKNKPAYVGSKTIIQTIIDSFQPQQAIKSYEAATKRWEAFQNKQDGPQTKKVVLSKKELLKKINEFLPENLNREDWELWFNSRDAIIKGIERALNLYQNEKKLPGILAFQELTATEFIDLKKAFSDYKFIGFDALDGKCVAQHIEYDVANNKGPSGLGNLNMIMYSKDDFEVLDTHFAYLMPNDPKTKEDKFQHQFNIACFVLKHHRSGIELSILNSHFPSNPKALPQVLMPSTEFINWCTKNQKTPYVFVVDGNLYPDTEEGLEGYRFLRNNLQGAIDWRYAEELKYYAHHSIASTSFTGYVYDSFKTPIIGGRFAPKSIDMKFVSCHFKIIAALNDGIPLNITNGQVSLVEAGAQEEDESYRNHRTASDHTFSLLILDPVEKPVKSFNKLKQSVIDALAVRDKSKDNGYYFVLENILEEINDVSNRLEGLTVEEIKGATSRFRKYWQDIEKEFSKPQVVQPVYKGYGVSSEKAIHLGKSNMYLPYTNTPMLPIGNHTLAIKK
jgi:hypothetical protein